MIAVNRHHVASAIRAKEADNFWLVYGGTVAWPVPATPPVPALTVTAVATPIGVKRATARWVKPDEGGTIVFLTPEGESRWTEVLDVDDVIADDVHWVLISATVGDELPLTTFRQFGFYSAIEPEATELLPGAVTSWGRLEAIEYVIATPRVSGVSNVFQTIIEF